MGPSWLIVRLIIVAILWISCTRTIQTNTVMGMSVTIYFGGKIVIDKVGCSMLYLGYRINRIIFKSL